MLTPYRAPTPVQDFPPAATAMDRQGELPEEHEGVNWARLIASLLRYKWLIAVIIGLGAVGGALSVRFVKPEYQVGATIYINDGGGQTGERNGPIPIRASALLQAVGWVELLRSFAVVDPVVEKMKLYLITENGDAALFDSLKLGPKFRPGHYVLQISRSDKRYQLLAGKTVVEKGTIGDTIGHQIGIDWVPTAEKLGGRTSVTFELVTPREAAVALTNRMQPLLAEQSNFLRLRLSGSQSQLTASTLNEWLRQFIAVAADMKRNKLSELTRILGVQLAYAESLLKRDEVALESFRVHAITLPAEGGPVAAGVEATRDPVMQDYFAQRVAYENARRDRESLEQLLAQLRGGTLDPQAFFALPTVLANAPALRGSIEELQTKQAALRNARQLYTDEHKTVRDLRAAVDTLRLAVIPNAAESAVQTLRQREIDLSNRIKSSSLELQQIPSRTIEEMSLRREVGVADDLYRTLQNRYAEARLAEASATPDVAVLDTAVAPQHPEKSKTWRIGFMIVAASIGLAICLAILLDHLDRRFRYPEQATNELRLPIVGTIPALSSRRRTPDPVADIQVIESFRALRLQLQHLNGQVPLAITITSPGSGDGKSLVSANLALSFADAGYRTLLIDGDIRCGAQHAVFGAHVQPGLLNQLAGQASVESVIQRTPHDKLLFVARGARIQGGPELIASHAMTEFLAQIRTRFDAIILDSPPLGAGIDPLALAVHTRNLLLVLRIGETDRKLALAKLQTVGRLPIRVLGAVLNEVPAEGMYKYYAYGYGDAAMSAVSGSLVSGSAPYERAHNE
ncbi:MAG TPA: polysaccharide biosynthesis tyrosine autokinase [Gemmatimonadaceae bacterium]|nr:polysaccharide biosynthesis tyrosine autokinase [Gemmatimonadaceae bacterium]